MAKIKTSEIVEQVLRDDIKSRNSDKRLQFIVLQKLGFNFTKAQMEIWGGVSLESIRRTRQKLQEGGQYEPTDQVKLERRYRAARVQQTIKQTKAQNISDIID